MTNLDAARANHEELELVRSSDIMIEYGTRWYVTRSINKYMPVGEMRQTYAPLSLSSLQ